jgi:hypothetical protein
MQSFIDIRLMSDLSYVDGIDQNVMYPPTAPVPIWPERIYGTLYFAQTSKLLIEIIDTPISEIAPHISQETVSWDQSALYSPRAPFPPIHMPFFLEAAILSRMRSAVTFSLKLGKG